MLTLLDAFAPVNTVTCYPGHYQYLY